MVSSLHSVFLPYTKLIAKLINAKICNQLLIFIYVMSFSPGIKSARKWCKLWLRRLIRGLLRGGGIEQKRKREREREKELMGMDNSVVIAGSRGKGDE